MERSFVIRCTGFGDITPAYAYLESQLPSRLMEGNQHASLFTLAQVAWWIQHHAQGWRKFVILDIEGLTQRVKTNCPWM